MIVFQFFLDKSQVIGNEMHKLANTENKTFIQVLLNHLKSV